MDHPYIVGENLKCYSHSGKEFDNFLKKKPTTTKYATTRQCSIAFPGIYPRDMKIYVHTKAYTLMFIALVHIIAPNSKQPSYLLIGEWLNKLWYTHVVEYSSTIKSNRPVNKGNDLDEKSQR